MPVGPDNPHGNAFSTIREGVLANELAAQRTVDFNAARFWKIESADARNKLGQPTAYKLLPLSPVPAFASPQSSVARRAAFMTRQLWVTAYHPDEIHAAGRYPNQSSGGDGLPAWTAADRPLVDTRYRGLAQLRPAPHSPPRGLPGPACDHCASASRFDPSGFFAENPALDVPPIQSSLSCCVDYRPLGSGR